MPLRRVAAPALRSVDVNDLALNTTLYYAADLPYLALDIGLSSALFGILTLLVIVVLTFLIRKGFRHTPVKILLPSTLLLYGSTALFMASLAGHVTSINRLITQAQAGLFSDAYTEADLEEFQGEVLKHSWMMTVALSINLLIGDSIVWWRVCAVWRTRVINYLGPLLILLTFAFGMRALCGERQCLDPPQQPQTLFRDGFFADACTVLSLALNVLSTTLMGYKAWAHRRLLRRHLGCGRRMSHVVKALVLLVESGTIYCLLLIIVVVFQASPATFAAPGVHQTALFRAVADYTLACFIPVIAIYPVLIVAIVALNWSPIEHDLSSDTRLADNEHAACPPPRLDLNLDRTAMSTVVVIDVTQVGDVQSRGGEDGAVGVEAKLSAVTIV